MENNIQKHRQMVMGRVAEQMGIKTVDGLQKSVDGSVIITEEVFNEALEKGIITMFDEEHDDNLEKGMRDRSHLQKKVVTTSKGHRMTVYVKPSDGKDGEKQFNPNGIMQKKELTKEDVEKVKGHEHKLSHINRKRFDHEHEKHFGKDTDKTKKDKDNNDSSSKQDNSKYKYGMELGKTKSGKPIYEKGKPEDYKDFTAQDHHDAYQLHAKHTDDWRTREKTYGKQDKEAKSETRKHHMEQARLHGVARDKGVKNGESHTVENTDGGKRTIERSKDGSSVREHSGEADKREDDNHYNKYGVHIGYLNIKDKADFNAKPQRFEDVKGMVKVENEREKHYISTLPIVKADELPKNNPTEVKTGEYILEHNGQKYLVDTQGYDYPRYVTKLNVEESKAESNTKESRQPKEKVALDNFLDKFPNDAKSWSQATDEVRDIARAAKEHYNELDLDLTSDEVEDGKGLQPLDFKALKTPADWNKKGKEYIQNAYKKMSINTKKRFLESMKGFHSPSES